MEVSNRRHAPPALPPRNKPGTHGVGGWVVLRAKLNVLEEKKSFATVGIRIPDGPVHSLVTFLTDINCIDCTVENSLIFVEFAGKLLSISKKD